MTIVGDAYVEVKPDAKGFGPSAEKDVTEGAHGLATKVAGIMAGAFAVEKGFDFLKSSVELGREANKMEAQSEAAIKSTGGAAHVSAGQIDELAMSISRKTGIDHTAIQNGENLLLTFTNVRNEAGKGNDVFNQASKIMVDMGKALGGDASSSAIQLGKALNDPIKGITALTRVGVSFSAQQKEQIKDLTTHGQLQKAQGIILAELNKEFGGSAEAQATAADKFKVAWNDTKEQLGKAIIPIIDKLMDVLSGALPIALDLAGRAFSVLGDAARVAFDYLKTAWDDVVGGFQNPTAKLGPGLQGMERIFIQLGQVAAQVFGQMQAFWATLTTDMTENDAATPVEKVALVLREKLWPIVQQVGSFLADHWKPILIAVGVAFALLVAPVVTVVAGLTFLYVRFQVVRDVVADVVTVVSGLVDWIENHLTVSLTVLGALLLGPVGAFIALYERVQWFRDGVDAIVTAVVDRFGQMVSGVQDRLAPLSEAIGHIIKAVEIIIAVALAPIIIIWKEWGDQIMTVLGIVWDAVKAIVTTAMRVLLDVIDFVLAIINGDWGDAWHALVDIPKAVLGLVLTLVKDGLKLIVEGGIAVLRGLVDGVKLLWGLVLDSVQGMLSKAKDMVTGGFSDLVGFVKGLPGRLLDAVASLLDAGSKLGGAILDGIKKGVTGALGFAADLARGLWNAVAGFINSQIVDRINDAIPDSIGVGPFSVNLPKNPIPHIPTAHVGGVVPGTPGSETWVKAMAGERFGWRAPDELGGAGIQKVLAALAARPSAPLVAIDHVTMAEPVTIDLLGHRLAFALSQPGVGAGQ